MVSWPLFHRFGPIAVDLGSRSVKLVQMNTERTQVIESVRWDLPLDPPADAEEQARRWTKAIIDAREGRRFRGNEAVLSLGSRELVLQNIRVVKPATDDLQPAILKELSERAPFPLDQTEVRFLETADVRQGDTLRREVIVLGCPKALLDRYVQMFDEAGLRVQAIDIEPQSLLRCYAAQYRRDEDRRIRSIVVHVGHSSTAVVIAEGEDILFLKYVELGGKHFDEAVSRHLKMDLPNAWALRRNNGDRRADQQDPEVVRGLNDAIRPVVDKLANEVSLCIRYHNVTFRGQTLSRMVLGGGEATQALVERLAARVDMRCELGDPFRAYKVEQVAGRRSQWDVAIGMAMRAEEQPA